MSIEKSMTPEEAKIIKRHSEDREQHTSHKPEPNVAARSARTRGSSASRSKRVRDDCSQLAPVLRPGCGADPKEHDLKVEAIAEDVLTTRCVLCGETFTFRRAE